MSRAYYYLVITLVLTAILIPIIIFSVSKAKGTGLTFQARPENDSSYLSRYYQVQFRAVDEIYGYLKHLTKNYSFFCQLHEIGRTSDKGLKKGFPVYLLKISSGFPKPIILMIGGINANDWQSSTSMLYVANQLLANCSKVGQLITTYDFHFIPILNPDGYNYSRVTEPAITYPWSHTSRKGINWVLLEYLSVMGAQAAYEATGTQYKVIQSGRQVKDQRGKIDDWIYNIGVKKVLTIQTKFTADAVADPYESIIKKGTEVFAIIKEIGIAAFYQPVSYRRTHRKLKFDEVIAIGYDVFGSSSSTTSGDVLNMRQFMPNKNDRV